jgi:hypothetical protein
VRASRAALIRLADDLRSSPDVNPAGVAATHRLLTDATSPLYVYGQNDELWESVRYANLALRTG